MKHYFLVAAIGLIAACGLIYLITQQPASTNAPDPTIEVLDGDTFNMPYEGKTESIRLIGVDTPEIAHDGNPAQCYSDEARTALEQLLGQGTIKIVPGVEQRDDYGRLLAYVYAGDTFVNAELVRQGFARYYTFEPNDKYHTMFEEGVSIAIQDDIGLWAACPDAMTWAAGG